ncbi:hypothetical protein K458DRAFT_453544 [Lentithecium fluviatile CBS 122367]|uniref:Uncharacterized protein n=1 Tax=Lentithecium fluviatile CBS 122367 TaxID=1168545 RepID=A0A6G1IYT7_9PLEO|nr:hypothetical protein K458DRAFT_453544 [Lentithecium fluviatile CBS 122367]
MSILYPSLTLFAPVTSSSPHDLPISSCNSDVSNRSINRSTPARHPIVPNAHGASSVCRRVGAMSVGSDRLFAQVPKRLAAISPFRSQYNAVSIPQIIPSSHFPCPALFFSPSSPGVNSSADSTKTAGTTASASTVPLLRSLLPRFIAAATSLLFTSFLMRGHASSFPTPESTDDPRRWKGRNEASEWERGRGVAGDGVGLALGFGTGGSGMLISV